MTDEPFEPDEGQESEPPNTGLAVLVALLLLQDVREYLLEHEPDADLLLRIGAVVGVLRRVREVLADADDR